MRQIVTAEARRDAAFDWDAHFREKFRYAMEFAGEQKVVGTPTVTWQKIDEDWVSRYTDWVQPYPSVWKVGDWLVTVEGEVQEEREVDAQERDPVSGL
jgi:hypothetical protein